MKLCLLVLAFWSQEAERALPDKAAFIAGFRKTLHDDEKLLSQYTYTEKETETTLDSKGLKKKTEINVYQVIHGAEEWQTYRRHIVKNGVALTGAELQKQDREEQERVAKETHKRANQPEAKRREEKAKADRDEQEALDDVFAMFDVQLIRREPIGGTSTILASFKPKASYKPKTRIGKILQHITGRMWIAEDDHELARVEGEVIDAISIGGGFLAKLQKGSRFAFERRKINGEIWLPVREEAFVDGRLLLVKGLKELDVVEYSDHKKYSVDTILKFPEEVATPKPD